ncbi:MAG TPA: NUDIX hydrolase [Ktedonobacterales bacterium]
MSADKPDETPSALFRIACSAIIERGGRYLLARRRDIGWWNLPGGGLELDETVDAGLAREVREEIGVEMRIVRLVGVYSKPQKREVVLTFLCKLADDATPGPSDEISEVGWFAADALPADTLPKHRQRVLDAALGQPEAILRAQTTSTAEDQRLG